MRKHGWHLPYHPLQVVAIAVFVALGFAFYVFIVSFVGKKLFQYVIMGLYTGLITCVFSLYAWSAATDPGDPGIFRSKKYRKVEDCKEDIYPNKFRNGTSIVEMNSGTPRENQLDRGFTKDATMESSYSGVERENLPCYNVPLLALLLDWYPVKYVCDWCNSPKLSPEQQMSEEGMFYCSLCEVDVLKYSKHCRACDKCVDVFDHCCRWLNNCVGRKNYKGFFVLMASALLLAFCTFLAMVATLPLAQLCFFHMLLVKKGISTYDYVIALREQEREQATGDQESPQMSRVSSMAGLSTTSPFIAFHRGAWCTPPRSFLEEQFDVVHPNTVTSVNHSSKKALV